MIQVDIYYQETSIRGYAVTGHAGYAKSGEDVVCAAVSALTQTALLGLNEVLQNKPQWKIAEEGYLECCLAQEMTPVEQEKAQIILRTMELGLKNIQQGYEQFLTVCKRRWNECYSQ